MADENDIAEHFDFAAAVREDNPHLDGADTEMLASYQETPGTDEKAADTAEGRPRDEHGRFVKAEPEPQAEPEAETPAETAERLFAGKYKSPEDLEHAYLEAQKALGQQGQELGQLRQMFEERFAQLQEQTRPRPQYDWDSLIDEDPYQAIELAYQQGDQVRVQQAARAWEDVAPGAVKVWAHAKAQEQQIQALRAEIDQRFAPVQQESENAQLARLVNEVKNANPDFDELLPVVNEIAPSYGPLVAQLAGGSPAEKAAALNGLLKIARGERTAQVQATTQEIARQTAEEAQKARDDAAVVSAATGSQTTSERSGEQVVEDFFFKKSTSMRDAWTRD